MKKRIIGMLCILTLLCPLVLSGCNKNSVGEENDKSAGQEAKKSDSEEEEAKEAAPKTLTFRDVFGVSYETEINPNVAENPYDNDKFIHDGFYLSYDDEAYDTILGIDVSYHQGYIDWDKVAADGYEFAILRMAYRGYSTNGVLAEDAKFNEYYKEARAAGLKVGAYFFSQAITDEEAKEEADFALEILDGREMDLPIVYDPEHILDDEARTDDVSGEQFTKNTQIFCSSIQDAGYEPMIYSNMLWEAFELDLETLSDYPVWYADYEAVPQTPYDFVFWQYTNEGQVAGISGVCDLDIWLKPSQK